MSMSMPSVHHVNIVAGNHVRFARCWGRLMSGLLSAVAVAATLCAGAPGFAASNLFPPLGEGQPLENSPLGKAAAAGGRSLVNGVDQADLTVGASGEAIITFKRASAQLANTIGIYRIDNGVIQEPKIIFNNTKELTENVAIHLQPLYNFQDLVGTHFGLFLIANGAVLNQPALFDPQSTLQFVKKGTTDPAEITDRDPPDLILNGTSKVRGLIYHALNPALNPDGRLHVVSGLQPGITETKDLYPGRKLVADDDIRIRVKDGELREGILVGFEDATDFDFNDALLQVNTGGGGLWPVQEGLIVPQQIRTQQADPGTFQIGAARDAEIAFEGEVSALHNTLGVYLIGGDGAMREPRIVFPDVEHREALDDDVLGAGPGVAKAARPGGGPLARGDSVSLRNLYPSQDLQPSTRFGLFLIQDAATKNPRAVFDKANTLEFVGSPNINTSTAVDIRLRAVSKDGSAIAIDGLIFHSVDRAAGQPGNPLNDGGQDQALIARETVAGQERITVAFEDFVADATSRLADFNDLIVRIEFPGGTSAGSPPTPTLLRSFRGITLVDDTNGTPPDSNLAVGLDHVVSVTNQNIEWYDKSGNLQHSETLDEFVARNLIPEAGFDYCGTSSDHRIIYDTLAHKGRFVYLGFSAFATSTTTKCAGSRVDPNSERDPASGASDADPTLPERHPVIGVSDGNDPNGRWFLHVLPGTAADTDYPTLAVGKEAAYVAADIKSRDPSCGLYCRDVELWIIDKGESGGFYDGGPMSSQIFNVSNRPRSTGTGSKELCPTLSVQANELYPALILGDQAPPDPIGTYLVGYDTSNRIIEIVQVENPLSANPTCRVFRPTPLTPIGRSVFAQTPETDAETAPQAGTRQRIEVVGTRVYNAVWRDLDPGDGVDGNLYFTTVAEINDPADPEFGQKTAFWFRVNTAGMMRVVDQGRISGDPRSLETYFPAISVNAEGKIGLGFSASSADFFAGSYISGVLADGTRLGAVPLREGEAPYVLLDRDAKDPEVRNRWGDYSGLVVDPEDDTTFWAFNQHATPTLPLEYYANPALQAMVLGPGDGRYATAFGHFSLGAD